MKKLLTQYLSLCLLLISTQIFCENPQTPIDSHGSPSFQRGPEGMTISFTPYSSVQEKQNPPATINYLPDGSITIERNLTENVPSTQAPLDEPALAQQLTQTPQENGAKEDETGSGSQTEALAMIEENDKEQTEQQEKKPITTVTLYPGEQDNLLTQKQSQELEERKSAKEIRGEERKAAQIAIAQKQKAKKLIADKIAHKKVAPQIAAFQAYSVRGFLSGKSGQEAKEYARRAKQYADLAQNMAKEGKIDKAVKLAEQAQQETEKAKTAAELRKKQIEQENEKMLRTIQKEDEKLAQTVKSEQEARQAKKAIVKPIPTTEVKTSLGAQVKNWLVTLFKAKK